MVEWTLISDRDGEWHEYLLMCGSTPVAHAKWRKHGNDAEIHNDVYRKGKEALQHIRSAFEDVKADMKAEGVEKVIVMSDHHNKTMGHYWKLMGFEFMDTYEDGTHTVRYAVMEV